MNTRVAARPIGGALCALAALMGTLLLAGCSGGGAGGNETRPSNDAAQSDETESSTTTTSYPTPTPTYVPPATTGEPAPPFTGVIDYSRFLNWENADAEKKDAACADFFIANLPPESQPTSTVAVDGPGILEWYNSRIAVLSALNSDRADPRNNDAAVKLAECLTEVHDQDATARTALVEALNSQAGSIFLGSSLPVIDPAHVTRYGTSGAPLGTTFFTDYLGYGWESTMVEGEIIDEFGGTLYTQVFSLSWIGEFRAWKLSLVAFPGAATETLISSSQVRYNEAHSPVLVVSAYEDTPWFG